MDGVVTYAKSIGCKVTVDDAQGSVNQAASDITNLVQSGATAIAVSVFPSSALASGIASAAAKGVPVANWGGGLATGVPIAADVGLGDGIAKRVVADMGGKGALLDLGYRPGLPCQEREKSLLAAVKGTSINVTQQQITIPGQVTSANAATTAWAAAHPAGSGPLAVWACFDDPATGAAAALRSLGRTDVKVYGLNGTAAALALVKSGGITATAWVDGTDQGVELGKLLQQAGKEGKAFKPILIGGKTVIVDKSNVVSFLAAHPALATK